jgi:DNA-binding NarL/FixJ family response regulator
MGNGKSIRVVLVDDYPLLHEAVRFLIEERDDMVLAASETSAVRGLRMVGQAKPDVAVIDSSLPELDGLALAERVIAEYPETKVVMLSARDDHAQVQRALEVGVRAFVPLRSRGDQLLQAITAAAKGGMYVDSADAGQSNGLNGTSGCRLTDREADVVRLVALGHSNREIAGQIGLTTKSVEASKSRACKKLAVRSRRELVKYAAVHGWLN